MSKVIKAVFTGRFCKTQRVFQFDTDDKLQIVNVDLPANYTVDFSNSKTGDSVSVLATSDTVQIPPDLFVPGSEIYAWIWLSDSNGGHTRCEATIPIDPRARRTGTEPTPAQASAWDEAVDTLNETIEGIPTVINSALTEAKESGEFDGSPGADGSGVWYTTGRISGDDNPFVRRSDLIGREGATVQVHDLLFAPDVRDEGEPTTLYEITSVGLACALNRLCKMKGTDGEDGTSPGVTITEIEGGHRITITDEAHPDGQSFDVMDGTGGSGSSDYNDLSNKPQIAGVTLSGDKSLADLGIAAASDIPTVPSAYTSTPADLGTASAGSSTSWAKGDHVHKMPSAADVGAYALPSGGIPKTDLASDVQTSLGKADTALQTAPVTSVNGQTGAVTVPEPYFVTYSLITGQGISCNRTYSQIASAALGGKFVVAFGTEDGSPSFQLSTLIVGSLGELIFRFNSKPDTIVQITHYSTDKILIETSSVDPSEIGAVASNQGAANANKVLTVNSSGVVVPEDNSFVVTLTPTNPDFSGTMDKTPAELAAAYEARKRIVAYATAFSFRCELSLATIKSGGLYTFDFIALGELKGQDIMLRLLTSYTDSTYTVKIYPLATSQWTGGSY